MEQKQDIETLFNEDIKTLFNEIDILYDDLISRENFIQEKIQRTSKVFLAIWGGIYMYTIASLLLPDHKPFRTDNIICNYEQDNLSCTRRALPMQKKYEIPLEFLMDVD